jgi:hypothetical protein
MGGGKQHDRETVKLLVVQFAPFDVIEYSLLKQTPGLKFFTHHT